MVLCASRVVLDPVSSGRSATRTPYCLPRAKKLVSDTTEFGSFTDAGEYIPRTIVENDLGATSFADAIDGTIVEFEDGDLVTGTVVRIDRDEVLLDLSLIHI